MKIYNNPAITPIKANIIIEVDDYEVDNVVMTESTGDLDNGLVGIKKQIKIDAYDLAGAELKMNSKIIIDNDTYNVINPKLKKNNFIFDDFWLSDIKLVKRSSL
jgi:hypothetical protein